MFKASSIVPAKGYEIAKAEAWKVKQYSQGMVTQLSSDVSAQLIISILNNLSSYKTRLENVRSIPGIAQYARDQENDQNYDVVAEFLSLLALIDAAIAEIQSTNTNVLISGWSLTGIQWNTFTSAQTANLALALQAIANAVE